MLGSHRVRDQELFVLVWFPCLLCLVLFGMARLAFMVVHPVEHEPVIDVFEQALHVNSPTQMS